MRYDSLSFKKRLEALVGKLDVVFQHHAFHSKGENTVATLIRHLSRIVPIVILENTCPYESINNGVVSGGCGGLVIDYLHSEILMWLPLCCSRLSDDAILTILIHEYLHAIVSLQSMASNNLILKQNIEEKMIKEAEKTIYHILGLETACEEREKKFARIAEEWTANCDITLIQEEKEMCPLLFSWYATTKSKTVVHIVRLKHYLGTPISCEEI